MAAAASLKVYHSISTMIVRVGHKRRLSSEMEEQLYSRLRRPIAFGWNLHGKTARSALYLTVKVAGGGTSVHACAVFLRGKSRSVILSAQTPY